MNSQWIKILGHFTEDKEDSIAVPFNRIKNEPTAPLENTAWITIIINYILKPTQKFVVI